jgi:RNA polymerase sigma-54 factor
MALQTRLVQKMSQTMLLTPQLRQSLEMLLLNHTELSEKLENELLENPFLETVPDEPGEHGERDGSAPQESAPLREESKEPLVESTVDWESFLEHFHDHTSSHQSYEQKSDTDTYQSVEANCGAALSLQEHLLEQLRLYDCSAREQEIASYIIGNLNRDGYLCMSHVEVADKISTSVAEVERALEIVQSFDPEGIGAQNLSECLLSQLEHQGLESSLAARIIRNHLPLLQEKKFEKIAHLEHETLGNIQKAVIHIRSLEPRPGRPFYDDTPSHITPDIYVTRVGDDYVISLNEDNIPRLRVSPYYLSLMRNGENCDKSFVNERLKAASWLIKSIYQRRDTMYRVTESIIKFQRGFFDHGVDHLRPLVLKDVALDVGLHESTISRVTTNKYVDTPQGLFELKYFFNGGVKTEGGDIASTSLKQRIKQLIAKEDHAHPLSDQQICAVLHDDGITLARRTVAKYREELTIPSSSQRKKTF